MTATYGTNIACGIRSWFRFRRGCSSDVRSSSLSPHYLCCPYWDIIWRVSIAGTVTLPTGMYVVCSSSFLAWSWYWYSLLLVDIPWLSLIFIDRHVFKVEQRLYRTSWSEIKRTTSHIIMFFAELLIGIWWKRWSILWCEGSDSTVCAHLLYVFTEHVLWEEKFLISSHEKKSIWIITLSIVCSLCTIKFANSFVS